MLATLGIDLGTSGVRAVTVTPGYAPVARSVRLDPARRRDPKAVWAAVTTALEGLDLSRVGALAVDGTSGTILPVATDGTPVAPFSLYSDAAGDTERAAITEWGPPDSAARSITSPLARAIALQHVPNAARIMQEADWIAGQFSGRFDVTDENNALKTGYDLIMQAWPGWVEAAGMPIGKLPLVVQAGTALGRVTTTAAKRFGLPPEAIVAAGTTDGCASFLATGADRPGDAVTALGSTTTLKLLADRPVSAPQFGVYSHRVLGRWLAGGASNAGGAVLARFFSPEQLQALSAQIDPAQPSRCDFYPLPAMGERFPINDPALLPRLSPRPADDAAFLCGLLEGLARIEALGYRRLAELGAPPVRRVLTVGGGSANPVWTAIRTRVLGVPVETAPATEAAHGAAILARSAL